MNRVHTEHLGRKRGWAYLGLFLLVVTISISAPPVLAATSFSDVPAGHPYAAAIGEMASLGIVGGYDDGTFRPDKQVLRKHFAKMIVGTMSLAVTEDAWSETNPPFTDCGPDDPNDIYPHDFIAVAKATGLTAGQTATKFAPEANITRAQMVTMVVRAAQNFGIALKPVDAGYAGVLLDYADPPHGDNAHLAEYNGLLKGVAITGKASSWLAGNATRGEVAQVLWNLYGLYGGPPVSGAQLIFFDGFSTKATGWSEGTTERRTSLVDTALSRYLVTLLEPGLRYRSWLGKEYSDFIVEVDAYASPAEVEGGYGLLIRWSPEAKNGYLFVVSNQGYWQLWLIENGEYRYLTEVQDNPSPAIRTGSAWNHLTAKADGDRIDFYVNGTWVVGLTRTTFTSGSVGLDIESFSSGGVQVGFDNFKIWSLP